MDQDVIEIPSSPELAPAPSRRRQDRRQKTPRNIPVIPAEIIILTDSDDDVASESNAAGPFKEHLSRADPSASKELLLFLPDTDDEAQPGPSNRKTSPDGQRKANDDEALSFVPLPPHQPGSLLDTPTVPPVVNSKDQFIAQVLEIVPDVDPTHVLELMEQFSVDFQDSVVEHILHRLFEDPAYPKVDKGKGKRKRDVSDEDGRYPKQRVVEEVDYMKITNRTVGKFYLEATLEQLSTDFPLIPRGWIRSRLGQQGGFYAPAYFALEEDQNAAPLLYKPNVNSRVDYRGSKGKEVARTDPDFEQERAWVLRQLQKRYEQKDQEVAAKLNEEEYAEAGAGIECGCCFTDYAFDNMIQCPDAHLFCKTCMTTYAENLLGSHNHRIVCMDQSGCKLPFTESELRRFLSPKLWSLYERVKQQKEIEAAGLDGLEECPFCEYKVVIENEQERLFHCQNEDCGAVTCRSCKKPDHLPKTCKEVEEDKKLDGRHTIEEAMTRALMRNCPKCKRAFVKDTGCNKMSCPHCNTLSCYICRQVINGYDHFDRGPTQRAPKAGTSRSKKCPLYLNTDTERLHAEEVAEAAKKALEEYKRDHPDVDEKELQVELPKAPPVPAPAPPPALPLPVLQRNAVPMFAGQPHGGGVAHVHPGHHAHHHARYPFMAQPPERLPLPQLLNPAPLAAQFHNPGPANMNGIGMPMFQQPPPQIGFRPLMDARGALDLRRLAEMAIMPPAPSVPPARNVHMNVGQGVGMRTRARVAQAPVQPPPQVHANNNVHVARRVVGRHVTIRGHNPYSGQQAGQ